MIGCASWSSCHNVMEALVACPTTVLSIKCRFWFYK